MKSGLAGVKKWQLVETEDDEVGEAVALVRDDMLEGTDRGAPASGD